MLKSAMLSVAAIAAATVTATAAPTFYVGLQGGWEWSQSDVSIPNYPANFTLNSDGFIGGGFAGVTFDLAGPWSVGVEVDGNWTDADGSHSSDPSDPFNTEIYIIEQNWNASVRGRVGYDFDKTTVFATAGWTWAEAEAHYFDGGVSSAKRTANVDGWTVGVGAEHNYQGGWFARVEYRYSDTDRDTVVHGGPSSFDLDSHTVLVGVGLKFS